MTKIKTILESKAFWLGLLSTIAAAAAVFGYNVPVTTILAVMTPIMIAIGGAGWSDAVVAKAKAEQETQLKMHLLLNEKVEPQHLNAAYAQMASSKAPLPPRVVPAQAGFITMRLMLLIMVAPVVLGITVAEVGCSSTPPIVTDVIECAKAEGQAIASGYSVIQIVEEVIGVLSGKVTPACAGAQNPLECKTENLILKFGEDVVACVIDSIPESPAPDAGSGSGSALAHESLVVTHKHKLMRRFAGKKIVHNYNKGK